VSRRLLLVAGVLLLGSAPAFAATGGESVEWFELSMGLFGGLAIFLFGMDQMAKGMQAAAGDGMKLALGRITRHRFVGALAGAVVTAVLNSSSVTTVLVVGFITAGLMSMAQSISVILGANIGSTFTAQVIAFKVTKYALAMVALGFAMLFASSRDRVRHSGSMVMGLGLVFFGMGLMGESMAPLRHYPPFLELMTRLELPILGMLAGTLFTGLIQSSAATTGIAIVMASEGLVTLPAGISLALGANIGTCITAVLASLGKPREAQRAAAVHVLFNVVGVLVWLPLIDQLAQLVSWVSPAHPELTGTSRIAAEVPRQIANAHTTFNVANTLLFIGFTGPFARLVEWLLPDRPAAEREVPVEPRFLDEELIRTPSLALQCVRLEVGHLGEIVERMLGSLNRALASGQRREFEAVARMDDQVDLLQSRILDYLGRVRRRELTDAQSREFITLMSASDYLESVGDTIETNLVESGIKALDRGVNPSDAAREMLRGLYSRVDGALATAVRSIRDDDQNAAREVMARGSEVNRQIELVLQHQARRLASDDPMRPTIFRVEMELVESLKRVYALSKRIAKVVLAESAVRE
jgi:phosphate:Na+ symporter